ncbi:hypothetical protein D3C81_2107090 [compost metagenome]
MLAGLQRRNTNLGMGVVPGADTDRIDAGISQQPAVIRIHLLSTILSSCRLCALFVQVADRVYSGLRILPVGIQMHA